MEKKSRREFLKESAVAALGLGTALPMVATACSGTSQGQEAVASGTQWGMVIDMEKAQSEEVRLACVNACRQTHNLSLIHI